MASVVSSLAVEIGAEIRDLQRGLGQADREVGGFAERTRQHMMKLGAAMTAGVTLPLAGLGAAAAKTAIAWESAFAGVRKTVDATEQEFAALARGLRDMATGATGSPVAGLENAAVTLAGVAEAAGQLGVAKENILEFTETMAMLGMATNLTAEEAATALAQFANIVQMPLTEIDRLGSAIVALGNNSATTERDIVEFAQRLAGAGAGAGMTEANILALSAAMASVGLNAEAGGTAMTQVMNAITKAVAGGGRELADFAKLSGVSAENFARWWEGEPISALESFIRGLGELDNQQQVLMLDQMGLSGIRVADTLRRLAGNTEVLGRSIEIANAAWEENNALVNEAEQRFMTTEAQLNLLSNNLKDVGITVGSVLLPPINAFVGALVPLLQRIASLNPEIVQIGVAFAAAAMAAGPLLIVAGALISPVGLIAGGIAAAAVAIAGFKDEIIKAVPWLDDLLEGARRLFDMFGAGDAEQAASDAAQAVQTIPKVFDVEIPAGQTVWDAWATSYKEQFPDWQEFRGLAEEALAAQGLTFSTLPGGGLSIQFPMGTEIVPASGGMSGRMAAGGADAAAALGGIIQGMSFGEKLSAAFGGTELAGIADAIAGPIDRLVIGLSRLRDGITWFFEDVREFNLGEAIAAAFGRGTGMMEHQESWLEGVLVGFGMDRDRAIRLLGEVWDALQGFAQLPSRFQQSLSQAFAGPSPTDMLAAVNSEMASPQGGGIDLSNVQTWAEQNFNSIVGVVATAAGMILGGPASLAIGGARLLASAIANDFLGIKSFLDNSGITAAVESAFNGILNDIRGIFGGNAPSQRMVAGGADAGTRGGPLDGLFAGLLNFTPPDLTGIVNVITGLLSPLREAFEGAWSSVQPHLQPFVDGIRGFFEALSVTDLSGLDNIAGVLAGLIGSVFGALQKLVATAVELGGAALGGVLGGLASALPVLGEGLSSILSAFSIAAETGDVGAALGSLANGLKAFGGALLQFGVGAADGVIDAIEAITGLELPDMQTMLDSVRTGLDNLRVAFDNVRIQIETIVQQVWQSILDNIVTPIQNLWATVEASVQPFLTGIQTNIIDPLTALWDNVKEGVERFWGNLAQIFGTINADIIQPIAQAISDVQIAIASLTGGLSAWGGVADNAGAAVGMVTSGQVSPGDFLGALGNAIAMEFGGGRALGGPVNPHQFYLVGENGPELFVPGSSGTVVPASSGAQSGGGSVTVNLTAYGQNPFEIYEMVRAAAASADR